MSRVDQFGANMAFVAVHATELQHICHDLAVFRGQWQDAGTGNLFGMASKNALVPTKLMQTVSALSAAMNSHQSGSPDIDVQDRDGMEVRLALAAIRIFDLAGALGYDLGAAMTAVMSHQTGKRASAQRVL